MLGRFGFLSDFLVFEEHQAKASFLAILLFNHHITLRLPMLRVYSTYNTKAIKKLYYLVSGNLERQTSQLHHSCDVILIQEFRD